MPKVNLIRVYMINAVLVVAHNPTDNLLSMTGYRIGDMYNVVNLSKNRSTFANAFRCPGICLGFSVTDLRWLICRL